MQSSANRDPHCPLFQSSPWQGQIVETPGTRPSVPMHIFRHGLAPGSCSVFGSLFLPLRSLAILCAWQRYVRKYPDLLQNLLFHGHPIHDPPYASVISSIASFTRFVLGFGLGVLICRCSAASSRSRTPPNTHFSGADKLLYSSHSVIERPDPLVPCLHASTAPWIVLTSSCTCSSTCASELNSCVYKWCGYQERR